MPKQMFRLGGELDKSQSARVLCFKERQTQEGFLSGGGGRQGEERLLSQQAYNGRTGVLPPGDMR